MKCTTQNCYGNILAKGLCTKCYYRVKRGGTPEVSKKQQMGLRKCSIEGCDKPHASNNLCAMHNKRLKLHGDPLFINPKCNREPGHEWTKERAQANTASWKIEHKEYYNSYLASCKRRVKQATPKWLDLNSLIQIYKNKPDGFEVDHIIPINSPNVCGLNVPWNLQYLTSYENNFKNNKFDFTFTNNTWRDKLLKKEI